MLDDVPGLGPTRRTRLLREFGSVKKLRELTEDDLVALPWLPDAVARATYSALHGGFTTPPIRTRTANCHPGSDGEPPPGWGKGRNPGKRAWR